jgi:hypothetical protein
MSSSRTQNFQWLAEHINGASSEIANWPIWKSQSSTRADCNSTGAQPDANADSLGESAQAHPTTKSE